MSLYPSEHLHAVLVHFPLAFLPLAVALDLVREVRPGHAWLRPASLLLWALGAVGAALAVWSGGKADEALFHATEAVEAVVARHADRADIAAWLLGLVAVARLAIAWPGSSPLLRRRPVRLALLAVAVLGLVLLADAARLGGELVYRYGVGTDLEPPPPP